MYCSYHEEQLVLRENIYIDDSYFQENEKYWVEKGVLTLCEIWGLHTVVFAMCMWIGDLPYIDSHTICKCLIYLFIEMYENHGLKSSLHNIWYVNNVTFQFTCW